MYFHYYEQHFEATATHRQGLVATLATHIHKTKDLLTKTGHLLGFPAHFGKNFDAFWDCLRDLPAEPKGITLVHQDLPKVDADDLETYLELLRDTVAYWQKHADEHVFEVWFPKKFESKVEAILKDIPPPEDEDLE